MTKTEENHEKEADIIAQEGHKENELTTHLIPLIRFCSGQIF